MDSHLLSILEVALFDGRVNENLFASVSEKEWKMLFHLAGVQGVLAIAWDEVMKLPIEQQPPRNLKLQWALSAEQIEKRYRKQSALAGELAQIYNKQGIKTIVLKGLAISGYYPVPEHRECGDLDCFLVKSDDTQHGNALAIDANGRPMSCYDEGNKVAKDAGADVEIGFYKHSHIHYKGLMVENHAFCTAIRGSKERKEFERHLRKLLSSQQSKPIDGTALLRPCADFNALFLTAHSFGHFLTEGIKLRHVLDWAYLLKAEQDNIDWKSFYSWCDKMHYTKFADALTAISVRHLGLTITSGEIHQHSDLADKVLNDIMNSDCSIHNTSVSRFKKRLMIIRNRMFGGWKYRELYEKSAFVDTMKMVLAFFIERKPKI